MTRSRLQVRAETLFVQNVIEMLEWIKEKHPDCQSTKDMLLLFKNVVSTHEGKRREFMIAWSHNMSQPLVRVKYSKALDRCLADDTDSKPCVVHAIHYKDINALETSCTAEIMDDLDLVGKFKSSQSSLSDEDNDLFWTLMRDITRNAFDACQTTYPRVPSRNELARHIKAKKGAAHADVSNVVQKAFFVAQNALFASRDADANLVVREEEGHAWCCRWKAFSQDKNITGKSADTLIAASEQCAQLLKSHFPELDWSAPLTNTEFRLIQRLISMSRVETAVPVNMMNQIEGIAGKLANDIIAGDRSLATLDMESIASEIQGKFTESDMQALAASMDTLLPALNNLNEIGNLLDEAPSNAG